MSFDTEVTQKLNQIRSLERQIDSVRAKAKEAKAKAKKYKERKRQVEKVKNSLYQSFDSYVDDIITQQRKLSTEIDHSVKGLSHKSSIESEISQDREKSAESDTYGSQAANALHAEISRCQAKIEEANSEASSSGGTENNLTNQRRTLVKEVKRLEKEHKDEITVHIPHLSERY